MAYRLMQLPVDLCANRNHRQETSIRLSTTLRELELSG